MLIKRCNPTTFDVFWNNGWEYWARFHRESDGSLKHLAGKQMPTKLFQQFRSIINKRGKGRQIQEATKELSLLSQVQQVAESVDAKQLIALARFQK